MPPPRLLLLQPLLLGMPTCPLELASAPGVLLLAA
jgi:hypothetical protein